MRKHITLGFLLTAITVLWMAAAPPSWRILPLEAQGAAPGWWALRQHALHLSGFLAVGLMTLCMVLALRQPWMERPLGGMDQVYRLHKWAGIGAGVASIAHWLAKESGGWIKDLWGIAGRPARVAALPWAEGLRSSAKDIGEIAFYILLVLLVVTLWQQLLNYRNWRWTHRVMPLIYLALVCHSVVLMPAPFWATPLGWMSALLYGVGSVAAVVSLSGRVGRSRTHEARVQGLRVLGAERDVNADDVRPLEMICAMPPSWPGHRPGQFVFLTINRAEGAHPFTIASAPEALGRGPGGEPLLRLVIKPLGDCTSALPSLLKAGQRVWIEGPYGRFDANANANAGRSQVWIAGGVGITPFLAFLESRQSAASHAQAGMESDPVHMHYCTRNAATDPLLARVRQLCEHASPPVQLTVHDAASGNYFEPGALARHGTRPLDIWLCGPSGLADAVRAARWRIGAGRWRLHSEQFAMR
ncbi:ferredoxin reductase family protein [Diaphorobacter aerolatus]|uniref:Ferric reductase-like transmembrane domain-containing protein n=1 Tax=Diaphorobacter aerolatus TaxID=1288495 RepID=A0A7H0GIC7_9BURK|nr:ferric reductase-like transmembrane domain-containing protein [Diaphorobacter aerolatus]QNP48043.1 ferric reductase-like transmembrane domain-containing protein [Diaphorobacter aerolatus]